MLAHQVAEQRRLEAVLREAESSRQQAQVTAQRAELEANRRALCRLTRGRVICTETADLAVRRHTPVSLYPGSQLIASSRCSGIMTARRCARRRREAAAAVISTAQTACSRQHRTGAILEQLLSRQPQPSPADGKGDGLSAHLLLMTVPNVKRVRAAPRALCIVLPS